MKTAGKINHYQALLKTYHTRKIKSQISAKPNRKIWFDSASGGLGDVFKMERACGSVSVQQSMPFQSRLAD